jgi:flagellar motor switch protein FliN
MNDSPEPLPELGIFLDLPLRLSAELPACVKPTEEVLRLTAGSVVAFEKMTHGPVLLFANRKLVARGEAVITGGNLGIKVTEINVGQDRTEQAG